jgi:hypothetical protein
MQFHAENHSLKAVPHGYFLSPRGLTSVRSRRSATGKEPRCYSIRRAVKGSTFAALRAGK